MLRLITGCATSRLRIATGATTTSRIVSSLLTTMAVSSLPTSTNTMASTVARGMSASAMRRIRRLTCEARSASQVVVAKMIMEAMRPASPLPATAMTK